MGFTVAAAAAATILAAGGGDPPAGAAAGGDDLATATADDPCGDLDPGDLDPCGDLDLDLDFDIDIRGGGVSPFSSADMIWRQFDLQSCISGPCGHIQCLRHRTGFSPGGAILWRRASAIEGHWDGWC